MPQVLGYNAYAYLLPSLVPGSAGASRDGITATMLGMRDLLIGAGLFTDNTCVVSLDPDPFPTPAPPMCAIAIESFGEVEPEATGGGRYEMVVEGEFSINVLIRHTKDIAGQDALFLTDATTGGLGFVFRCVNTLMEEFPLDANGKPVTTRGLKLGRIGKPRPWRNDKQLSIVPVSFRTRVILGLTLPDLETAP